MAITLLYPMCYTYNMQQIQTIDYENPLKSAFFTLREIPDPANKLESIKAELMNLIVEAQNDTFDKGGQQ